MSIIVKTPSLESTHAEETTDTSAKPPVDQGRRRLGAIGVSGSAVLLSLTSKSAVAGWGSCTGSELASGNLSKNGTANPCGCSPGFWWNTNGIALRASAPSLATYAFTKTFQNVFGRDLLNPSNTTLQDCGPGNHSWTYIKSGVPQSLAMHAVAALLNAAYYGSRYPVAGLQTPAAVIAAFQTAFDSFNPGVALTAFVDKVDIYGKTTDLWCNGSPENVITPR